MKDYKKSVAVLLAAYEGERFLKGQIDSILRQKNSVDIDFRIIIGSDPSTDRTCEISDWYAKKYDNVHHLSYAEPSRGAKRNFSRLMEDALSTDSGYFALSDQDDVWDEDKIEKSFKTMQDIEHRVGKDTPVLIFSDSRVVEEDLTPIKDSFWHREKLNPDACRNYKNLVFQNVGQGCTFFFNRKLLELAVPIPEEARMHDHWLMLVASVFGVVSYIKEPTMSYRQHMGNVVGSGGHGLLKAIGPFGSKLQSIRASILASEKQAAVFLKIFSKKMNVDQRRFFEAVANIRRYSFIKRRMFLVRNRVRMSTIDRTIGLYLFL
ncbi:glycosyltransferase family 2 protein [Marinobacter lutaoensis]|uniref:glycosyltransferase family 2 protein n=1 Tax=Marinobacter lutaoensis TaxID=135739 RepID=UPI001593464E|nr:glycosyltransferase family 2 protein [Marinobacter lutaoensis]NVD37016.1 glycosyltransferase family 2 protein [Marinobacter lutaoensis]